MQDLDYERICLCALNMLFGHKPSISWVLISELGSAGAVFRLSEKEKEELFGPYSHEKVNLRPETLEAAEKELKTAEKIGCRFLLYNEPGFPAFLSECEDPPVGIYFRSRFSPEEVFSGDMISVVGTRDLSPYGRDWCRNIVKGLADTRRNIKIVSGFAFGTDITAHRAAVENGLFTIGILPSGLDTVYPRWHTDFGEQIVRDGRGALISDYPFNTPVLKINFLRRNRLIAGLSRATILIESRSKGGGLITCQQAFSYNREVFALPGRADDVRSHGCNMLIRTGIATPIISVQNLIKSLGLTLPKKSKENADIGARYEGKLSGSQICAIRKVYEAVCKSGKTGLEELAVMAGLSFPETSAMTKILEADGFLSVDLGGNCSLTQKN